MQMQYVVVNSQCRQFTCRSLPSTAEIRPRYGEERIEPGKRPWLFQPVVPCSCYFRMRSFSVVRECALA